MVHYFNFEYFKIIIRQASEPVTVLGKSEMLQVLN